MLIIPMPFSPSTNTWFSSGKRYTIWRSLHFEIYNYEKVSFFNHSLYYINNTYFGPPDLDPTEEISMTPLPSSNLQAQLLVLLHVLPYVKSVNVSTPITTITKPEWIDLVVIRFEPADAILNISFMSRSNSINIYTVVRRDSGFVTGTTL